MKAQLLLWIALFRKQLIGVGIVFCAVFAWVLVPQQSEEQREQALLAWKREPENQALYKCAQNSLKKSPLRGAAAQFALVTHAQLDSVGELMAPALKELAAISACHAQYSKISLLIASKRYQEALEKTVSLKETLDPQSVLFACSLVRLAFLQEQLGNRAGEAAAWRDFDELSKKAPIAAEQALKGLGEKSFVLSYIESRRKALER